MFQTPNPGASRQHGLKSWPAVVTSFTHKTRNRNVFATPEPMPCIECCTLRIFPGVHSNWPFGLSPCPVCNSPRTFWLPSRDIECRDVLVKPRYFRGSNIIRISPLNRGSLNNYKNKEI